MIILLIFLVLDIFCTDKPNNCLTTNDRLGELSALKVVLLKKSRKNLTHQLTKLTNQLAWKGTMIDILEKIVPTQDLLNKDLSAYVAELQQNVEFFKNLY